MPTLRKRLTSPLTHLLAVGAVIGLVAMDGARAPREQVLVGGYVTAVQAYQSLGRPLVAGRVRCRYEPTCSIYSTGAVRRFGFARGVALSVSRLSRCRKGVPFGTDDPVPHDCESGPCSAASGSSLKNRLAALQRGRLVAGSEIK